MCSREYFNYFLLDVRRRSRRRSSILYTHFTCMRVYRSTGEGVLFLSVCVSEANGKWDASTCHSKKGCWPAWSIRQSESNSSGQLSHKKSIYKNASNERHLRGWSQPQGRRNQPLPLRKHILMRAHATDSSGEATGWMYVYLVPLQKNHLKMLSFPSKR